MQNHGDKQDPRNPAEAGRAISVGSLPPGQRVVVGLAELKVSDNPDAVLIAYLLGSCLAIAIYDPLRKIGGLLHAMLPDSTVDPARAQEHPGMFLDAGLPVLFQEALQMGADKGRLRIYVAGAAQIIDDSQVFDIGNRNCAALDQFLRAEGLQVTAREVGGHANRTLFLHIRSGQVRVKVSGLPSELQLC